MDVYSSVALKIRTQFKFRLGLWPPVVPMKFSFVFQQLFTLLKVFCSIAVAHLQCIGFHHRTHLCFLDYLLKKCNVRKSKKWKSKSKIKKCFEMYWFLKNLRFPCSIAVAYIECIGFRDRTHLSQLKEYISK